MACKVQKRIPLPLRRRLHILRVLNNSNHAKMRNSISKTTLVHIHKLKLALETLKREYENLIATRKKNIGLLNHVIENKDVKVEKIREGTFVVKVKCEKGGNKLVGILEAFEEMCVNVEQARVSCENGFSMEAIVVAEEDQTLDVRDVTQVLLKAVGKQSTGEKEESQELVNCRNL